MSNVINSVCNKQHSMKTMTGCTKGGKGGEQNFNIHIILHIFVVALHIFKEMCYFFRVINIKICWSGICKTRTGLCIFSPVNALWIGSINLYTFLDNWRIWVQFLEGQQLFPFSIASRPALGPTQPPIQCIISAFSLRDIAAEAWSWLVTSI
jgi:hypothetical protein